MQADYELCYCAAGRRAYILRDMCVILQSGQALLVPLQVQSAPPADLTGQEDGVSVFLSCTVSEKAALSKCFGRDGFIIVQSAAVGAAFAVLMQKTLSAQMRQLKITELLLLLEDLKPGEIVSPQCCTREELLLASGAFRYAMEHLYESLTVQVLAAHAGASATRLKAAFRQVYGLPVVACIRSAKLHRAARELLATDRRIIDIAQDAGYDNSSKFAHAFRAVMGMLPGEYRRYYADRSERQL